MRFNSLLLIGSITVAALAITSARGAEPERFRPGLYFAEVGVGAFLGGAAVAAAWTASDDFPDFHYSGGCLSEPEFDGASAWMLAYPLAMSAGTMVVGELGGAPSANRGTAYTWAALASGGGVAASLAIGAVFDIYPYFVVFGVIPNAFLNAAVYNWTKRPKANVAAACRWAPYVSCARAPSASGKPLPVYGLEFSF